MSDFIKMQNKLQEEGKDHQAIHGPCHIHLYNALLGSVAARATGSDKQILDVFIQHLKDQNSPITYLEKEVMVVQTSTMYESKYRRLEVTITPAMPELVVEKVVDDKPVFAMKEKELLSPSSTWATVEKILLRDAGAKTMRGKAPSVVQEKKLGRRLDN